MDFLGNSLKEIKISSNHKNSNPIDLFYDKVEDFCEATSKLINGFNDSCRFLIESSDSEKYVVDILDCRYNSAENSIRIFPESCRKYRNQNKNKQK